MIIQASYGGNFLLNIGPTPQGTIRDCEQHILSELGQWLRTNGASVYATAAAPESIKSIVGECTAKKDCLYLHIFRWPDCGEAVVSGVYRKVRTVRLLENGKEFPFVQTSTGRTARTRYSLSSWRRKIFPRVKRNMGFCSGHICRDLPSRLG